MTDIFAISPERAAERIYFTSRRGVTIMLRPDPEEFEFLAVNDLGESNNATPAISDGQIFLRGRKWLYSIRQ